MPTEHKIASVTMAGCAGEQVGSLRVQSSGDGHLLRGEAKAPVLGNSEGGGYFIWLVLQERHLPLGGRGRFESFVLFSQAAYLCFERGYSFP